MLTSNPVSPVEHAAPKLVPGTVRAMYEGKPVHEPWVQFLQIKSYDKTGTVHYKYPLAGW